jgi:DNA polymerase-3 subunit epsilon
MKTAAVSCFASVGAHHPGIEHLMREAVAGGAREFDAAANWSDLTIAFVDVETTGRDAQRDRIVELAIVLGRAGEVVARATWLVNPGRPIPAEVSKIHGIYDADVKNEPSFAEVADEISQAFEGALPAAYNAGFDRGFVAAEMVRAGVRPGPASPPALRPGVAWLDPLVWARHLHAGERNKSLGETVKRLGVKLENAHRATADAEAALLALYAMGRDLRVPRTYGALLREQGRLAREQERAMRAWRRLRREQVAFVG